MTCGGHTSTQRLKAELEKSYEIKAQVLGPDKGNFQQVRILNRIVTWGPNGISYEADPSHAEIVPFPAIYFSVSKIFAHLVFSSLELSTQ